MSPILALLLLAAPAAPVEPEIEEVTERDLEEDAYELRLSLPTQADLDAWAEAGFRVSLGWVQGRQYGRDPAPSFDPLGVAVRVWLRLDPRWSAAATASYQGSTDLSLMGLRWGVTAEAMWHVWRGLAFSVGLGLGGIDADREDVPPSQGVTEPGTRTLPASEILVECAGSGWLGRARLEYQLVVGPLFATGPMVQLDAQWTRCADDVGNDPETGVRLQRRQWWLHGGWNLGWWLTWR